MKIGSFQQLNVHPSGRRIAIELLSCKFSSFTKSTLQNVPLSCSWVNEIPLIDITSLQFQTKSFNSKRNHSDMNNARFGNDGFIKHKNTRKQSDTSLHITLAGNEEEIPDIFFLSFSDGSCWEIIIIKQIHRFTETPLLKQYVAGELVDLLDDILSPSWLASNVMDE